MSSEPRSAPERRRAVRARCSNPAKLPEVRRLWMRCITVGKKPTPRRGLTYPQSREIRRIASARLCPRADPATRCNASGAPAVALSSPMKCAVRISLGRAGFESKLTRPLKYLVFSESFAPPRGSGTPPAAWRACPHFPRPWPMGHRHPGESPV
jgi:hypothetical protein